MFVDMMVTKLWTTSDLHGGAVRFVVVGTIRNEDYGVSSGWSSIWLNSNIGLSSTQYEKISFIFGVWSFWQTFPINMISGIMAKMYFIYWNHFLSSGYNIIVK